MSSNKSQVTTLDDAPATASAPVKTTAQALTGSAASEKVAPAAPVGDEADAPKTEAAQMFNITIHATGDDAGNDIVEVQPNGRLYRLPRGVPCLVPAAVLHILENAVVSKYIVVGAGLVERSVPRFPFTAIAA